MFVPTTLLTPNCLFKYLPKPLAASVLGGGRGWESRKKEGGEASFWGLYAAPAAAGARCRRQPACRAYPCWPQGSHSRPGCPGNTGIDWLTHTYWT